MNLTLFLLNLLTGASVGWAARCLQEWSFVERDAWVLGVLGLSLVALGIIASRTTT